MSTTVAIVNWNSGEMLQSCIESLLASAVDKHVLVIDNNSRDGSADFLTRFNSRVRLIRNGENRGFAAALNQAFRETSTPYVLILNPDIRVLPGSVELLENFMDLHPKAGAAGGYVGEKYLPRNFPTTATVVRENLGLRNSGVQMRGVDPIEVDQPAAAAIIVRRVAYEATGPFDERFYPAWYEDVDYCFRMKNEQGWKIFFVPASEFIHAGGYSARALGSDAFLRAYYRNQVRYAQKHFNVFGTLAVRASVAIGVIGRMIARPAQAIGYAKVFVGALFGW